MNWMFKVNLVDIREAIEENNIIKIEHLQKMKSRLDALYLQIKERIERFENANKGDSIEVQELRDGVDELWDILDDLHTLIFAMEKVDIDQNELEDEVNDILDKLYDFGDTWINDSMRLCWIGFALC